MLGGQVRVCAHGRVWVGQDSLVVVIAFKEGVTVQVGELEGWFFILSSRDW